MTTKKDGKSNSSKNWIQGAIEHPGSLHKTLGIPEGKKIPLKTLDKATHSRNATTRRRAVLAETLRNFKRHKQ